VARVDFLLPELGVVVEFEGARKDEGADGRDALVREKRLEDALRALDYRVVRLTWADLHHPERVLAALRLTDQGRLVSPI
jgi:very-short-patch-repair endonuclease